MAKTAATELANFGSGIGTDGAVLEVDNTNQRVGLGTTNPQRMVQIGQNVTIDDSGINISSGVVTATTGSYSGTVTANSFSGDGANLTGVSGFGTALDSTQNSFGNLIFKTPYQFTITAGTSERVTSDTTSGGIAFTRLGKITVANGSTMTVSSGTTFSMDVLSIFP